MVKRGNEGEKIAADYLIKQSCQILERNFRCKYGEIDIIAREEPYLIIVEVKNRTNIRKGSPAEAVDWRKRKKICRTFNYYRMIHHLDEYVMVRFDVMEIYHSKTCRWIKNAFEYIE